MAKRNANLLGEITNEEEALAAVRKDVLQFQCVPENIMTAELCL